MIGYIIFGACTFTIVSSYFNVIISRGFKDSLIERSHCDKCKKELSPLMLVPIFSYLWLKLANKGKTYCCGNRLDINYFLTEVLAFSAGGITGYYLFLINEASGFSIAKYAAVLFFSLIFLYMAQDDIWNYEIDITLVIIKVVVLSLIALFNQQLFMDVFMAEAFLTNSILTAVVAAAITILLIVLSRGRGLGVADVFVVFFIGLSLGYPKSLIAILTTIFTAAFFGLIFAYIRRRMKNLIIPLVPFLYLGWLIGLTFFDELLSLYYKLGYILI